MNNEAPVTAPASEASAWTRLQTMQVPVWTLLVAVLIILLLLVWKQTAVSNVEADLQNRMRTLTEQSSAQRATLLSNANTAIRQNSDAAHVLMGTTLAWSIRGEMIRGNLGQIDEFFADLVRNERIQLVVLVDPAGRIVLASDRKLQDAAFTEHFPGNLLDATTVSVHPGAETSRYLLMPIQGLNSRLGSALLVYAAEPALAEG
jgi:hypothetical protein